MDEVTMRAWWSHRQGLDGSLEGATPGEVLRRSGWARAIGGVGPYLTLFARAGTAREEADAALERADIHELPSARGCTYVVPAEDYAIALTVGRNAVDAEMRTAAKLGVTAKEMDRLCSAVLEALGRGSGPMDPEAIRDGAGKAVRHLGEEGKKKGLVTTLPLALGRLQAEGEIRRIPVNGRIDQQRYRYALWRPNPLGSSRITAEEAFLELARRFFRWVGPATIAEFRWFSGMSAADSKGIAPALSLTPAVPDSERLLLPEDVDAFRSFKAPKKPRYALVGSIDAISATRRDVKSLLDPADFERKVQIEKVVGTMGGLTDLPNHAILDRGRVIGLWDYDPESESIAWVAFHPSDKALEAAVRRTEEFVRSQLGDARSFSLDSPKSRIPRILALRAMKSGGV